MAGVFYIDSKNHEFERAFNEEYKNGEENCFTGQGQRFYNIDGFLITITLPHSKYRDDIQRGKICIEIEGGVDILNIRNKIQNSTGFELEKLI